VPTLVYALFRVCSTYPSCFFYSSNATTYFFDFEFVRFQAAIFWLLLTLFRPVATLYDLNVGVCLMLLSPRSLARMGVVKTLICACAIAVPVLLYLVLHWMWLETGSGEAYFLYFQCLAYNIFVANLLVEFCGASVRRDKALRLTEKKGDKGNTASDDKDDKDRANLAALDDTTVLDDQ
jgi:hypothetical protein